MENKQNPRIYRLVPSEQLERLIKTNFLLSKGLLLFEYLCSQSDEPLFLTADAACEVLDIRPETLTRYSSSLSSNTFCISLDNLLPKLCLIAEVIILV